MLSVIIPAYNEEKTVIDAARTIGGVLSDAKIPYELLFVDDGSKDGTFEKILAAKETVPGVRGISFSRNFGKESAIAAGLDHAAGECCAVIDCDLQHPPEKLVEMYRLWEDGYEIVEGVKSVRGKESAAHGFAAKCFYALISRATGADMSNASDFKLLDRKAVDALRNMPEKNAFFRALSSWVGFRTTTVPFEVRERKAGESKWSTSSLIRYAVTNITSFTTVPMQLVTLMGAVMFVLALVLGIIALVQKFAGTAMSGFTTVIILQCFSGSVIMMSLGIIGYYIARIYEEIKGRPRYIISRTTDPGEDA